MKHLALSVLALAPAVLSQTQLPLPAFASTFASTTLTRGFYFQTPVAITIVGLRVPDEAAAGVQCVEVDALTGAPPNYPATASGGQVFYANNVPSSFIIPCRLDFAANSWIGVMGACGTTTMNSSYGNGPFNTTIAGNPVTLSRFLTQTNLNTSGGQPYSTEPTGAIGRVEVYYVTPPVATQAPLPAFSSTFASAAGTRGFYFQTPVPIIIRGLRVPDESRNGVQNVEVKRMGAAPPAYPATTSGGEVFYAHNVPSYQVIPCFLPFSANDWVGVIGACGTTTMQNSYGPAGAFVSSIAGNPVTLTRMGTQSNLNTSQAQPYWSEAAANVCRVEVYYEVATGVAASTPYGVGCNRRSRAFYELFSPVSTFDLSGSAMTLVSSGGHYNAIPTGGYVVPPGSATVLVLGDDSDTVVNLGSALSYPGGSTTSLRVCSNGFVSVGVGNGTGFTPSASAWCSSPMARWGDWHDFNPSVAGSGQVKFHEVGNVSYVTWDGVYSFGTTSPNTLQLQFDRSTGNVTYVFQSILLTGGNHLVGFVPTGGGADLGSMDISASLPSGFSTQNVDQLPLAFSSGRPVIGSTINLVTDNIPAGSVFGASLLGLVSTSVPLAPLGAPTCTQYVNSIVTNLFFGGPSVSQPFVVPSNPFYLGLHIYGQSASYSPGQNALNVLTSNGLDLLLDLN